MSPKQSLFPPITVLSSMSSLYLECFFHSHLCLLFQNVTDRQLACTFLSIQASKPSQVMPFGIWLGSFSVLLVLKRLLRHCHLSALNRTNTLENTFSLDKKVELVRELPKLFVLLLLRGRFIDFFEHLWNSCFLGPTAERSGTLTGTLLLYL